MPANKKRPAKKPTTKKSVAKPKKAASKVAGLPKPDRRRKKKSDTRFG